uniref:PHYHIP_C domain-containing protein n=1 Tax=Panagrellus redivivus TaxID=6233 RepID=A0A7E4UVY4_PANRE
MAFVQALPSAPTKNVIAICKDDLVNPVPEVPVQLDLQASTSTKRCTVRWGQHHLTDFKNYIFFDFYVFLYLTVKQIHKEVKHLTNYALRSETIPCSKLESSFATIPGEYYNAYIEVRNAKQKVVALGSTRFRASYSKDELLMLYSMAKQYSGTKMREIDEVYRCKPQKYWQGIKDNHNGIMKPYMKDENGHGANHINSVLKGLFFSAQLNMDGTKRTTSYFGDRKYSVTPQELFNPNVVNFYFCDFYCNANNHTNHFVTIGVCKKKSKSDKFCSDHLIPLPSSNPFFKVSPGKNRVYSLNQKVSVELFYTENVRLQMDRLKVIKPVGRGSSRPGGLDNNKTCKLCNFVI